MVSASPEFSSFRISMNVWKSAAFKLIWARTADNTGAILWGPVCTPTNAAAVAISVCIDRYRYNRTVVVDESYQLQLQNVVYG